MPTYQYRCTDCGEPLEAVQSFTDDPLTECPACTGTLRKVFSSVGVVFKGSGFYRTDSRAAAKGASKSGEGSGSGSEPTPSTTTPASPAPAPAAGSNGTAGGSTTGTDGGSSTPASTTKSSGASSAA